MSAKKMVSLLSSDEKELDVDADLVAMSVTLTDLIADCGQEGRIFLPNVKGEILEKAFEYCKYHLERGEPVPDYHMPGDPRTEWEVEYSQVHHTVIFDLLIAAHYLDIAPLVDLMAKTIAIQIQGKDPDEICRYYNVQEFTPEERELLRKENEWCAELLDASE